MVEYKRKIIIIIQSYTHTLHNVKSTYYINITIINRKNRADGNVIILAFDILYSILDWTTQLSKTGHVCTYWQLRPMREQPNDTGKFDDV